MSGHSLIMAFDEQGKKFARGFEAGRIYTLVGQFVETQFVNADDEQPLTVRGENAEMMLRIAERYEIGVRSEEIGDGWLAVTFFPRENGPQA